MLFIFEDDETSLFHYGTPRHSGRYPWGSGDNPYQHTAGGKFLTEMREATQRLKDSGISKPSDVQIGKEMGLTSNAFRRQRTLYRAEETAANRSRCIRLRQGGKSVKEIHERTGISERQIYAYLSESYGAKLEKERNIVNEIRVYAEKNPYLDVGDGVANQLGISDRQLDLAIDTLSKEGYHEETVYIPQATNPSKNTTYRVLVRDGVTYNEVLANKEQIISPLGSYTEDGGKTWENIKPPVSIDSKRIMINYPSTGGGEKDGVIELRRGAADLSLGGDNYAQVRIAVDDKYYLKGMAVYSDDLPDGIDIRFNTSKSDGTPMMGSKDNTVLKPLKDEKDNPFGSTVRQRNYKDANGEEHQSPINIVNDDSDWEKWSKTLPSQVLSKQTPDLARKQLGLVYDEKKQQFEEIKQIQVPAVKEKLLTNLADTCDSAAVDLKAAALPRQCTQVILPLTTIKDNEVYAPNFNQGETIALIRYPHAGPFEIPVLKVNNRNPEGKKLLGPNAENAIGISSNTAVKLSGADFDGDTVTAIPIDNVDFKSEPAIAGLKEFTETFHDTYKAYPGMTPVGEDGFNRGREMGIATNLIADMGFQGASNQEKARAVEYSQVVIDAEKHNLNWKQAYEDLGIQALKNRYQPKDDPSKPGGGAHTLITKAKNEMRVPVRKDTHRIDPETGKKIMTEDKGYIKRTAKVDGKTRQVWLDEKTGGYYYLVDTGEKKANGKPVKERVDITVPINVKEQQKYNLMKSTQMAETDDAYTLSSGTKMEGIYANHANKLKALANTARKETLYIKSKPVDKEAAKIYSEEVNSLKEKLDIVKANRPKERQAQALASKIIDEKLATGSYDEEHENKLRQRVITEARARVGSQSKNPKSPSSIAIYITDGEWEAIQNGAVNTTTMRSILNYADMDRVKELALPNSSSGLTPSKLTRAKALIAQGLPQSDVAKMVGVSVSTLKKEGVLK